MKTISLDAMGGDYGPKVVVPAAVEVLKAHPHLKLILVGLKEVLEPLVAAENSEVTDRLEVHHASEVVSMDELPSQALRSKKDSSMRVAINLIKEGKVDACVSAGNTGALMATARFVLKTLPGIHRPAIITSFPTQIDTEVYMLDLGANVDSSAEMLEQFAAMGSILVSAVSNIEHPKIGLLNIGEEEIKGNEQVKKTAELLSQNAAINYIGYVEGDDIFTGVADVVVCDGFIGNITLKACEGLVKLISQITKETFKSSWLTQLAALPALPVFSQLRKRIDPRRRNGATFIGLDGVVVKSHGGAGVLAFISAIEEAIIEVEKNVPDQIRQKVIATLSK